LQDNPCLHFIEKNKSKALIVYIHDEIECQATGQAGHWWLHESLKKLEKNYKQAFQIQLIIQKGEAGVILTKLIKKYKITQVIWNRLYSSNSIKRDSNLKKTFKNQGLDVETFNGHLLNEPWEVQNNSGQYFKVFTPYWKKAWQVYLEKKYQPLSIKIITGLPHSEKNQANFLPPKKWYKKFEKTWIPGEQAAHQQLQSYISINLSSYKEARDRPDLDQTSKLSPYLRFGEISARTIIYDILKSKKQVPSLITYIS